ncbi:MAG: glycosyltransferase family 39 protein [Chloroflexi bacterium]|nr:glycosyltransferase family 39 protein [Chloroflexota bacterium]
MPWLFFAAAFESLLAGLTLALIPSEGGFSSARLVLFGILAFFFFGGVAGGWIARRGWFRFEPILSKPFLWVCSLIVPAAGAALFLLRYLDPERLLPYYERLSPLLWLLLVVAAQTVIFLLLSKNGFHPREFAKRKAVYLSSAIAFGFLFVIFLFVVFTRLGVIPDTAYWGEPGAAILGWQFVLSIIAGFVVLIYFSLVPRPSSLAENFLFPFIVYLAAAALWLSAPVDVLRNSFYAPITPPANIPLPYSDAGFYDFLSQSLLIGTAYLGGVPPRPFYVVFLAALHLLFGQDYVAIIAAQTLTLAFFPVALYFLAKKLHSPAAGVTAAFFAVFRELVGLWISSNIRAANSKTFTTDFPTAMALAFLCLVLIWWLERRDLKSTLAAGGFFGLVLLFRTQSLLVLPVVFALTWFVYQRRTKDWFVAGAVFAAAMLLAVLPWLTHNYTVEGRFTFDDPRQSAVIYSQYSFTGNLDLAQFNPETDSVGERMVSFTLENPAYVAGFIAAHILNTEIGGLLALPLIADFESLSAPVNIYWGAWDGTLAWYNAALLIFYLAVIAVGLGAAWKRAGWLGLIPLAVNLGYALSNGVSRFSGWRYNLPVDWAVYFYFALGALEILGGLTLLFGAQIEKVFPVCQSPKAKPVSLRDFRPQYVFMMFVFAFIGSLPWLAKEIASPRYTASTPELMTKLETSGYSAAEIKDFLSHTGAVMMEGRLLYPRMYWRGEGLSSANPWQAYAVRDFPRIGFLLLNDRRSDMIFPTRESLNFPQGADVIVVACEREGYYEARLIDFGTHSYQSAPLSEPCSIN